MDTDVNFYEAQSLTHTKDTPETLPGGTHANGRADPNEKVISNACRCEPEWQFL